MMAQYMYGNAISSAVINTASWDVITKTIVSYMLPSYDIDILSPAVIDAQTSTITTTTATSYTCLLMILTNFFLLSQW